MDKILIALAILLAVLLIAVGGFKLYDYLVSYEFYNNSEVAFKTPGVDNSTFVPQGMDYDEERELFLFTGFMDDGTSSRVYVRYADGTLTYTKLMYDDGTPYAEHTGGIQHYGDYIYITGKTGIDVFRYSDFLEGKETSVIIGNVPILIDPAYCYITSSNGRDHILIGSFYKEGSQYITPEHERITTPCGDNNTSVLLAYRLDKDKPLGFDDSDPIAAISMPKRVQGICVTDDGRLVTSVSWGVSPSELGIYNITNIRFDQNYHYFGTTTGGIEFDMTIPMYYIESDTREDLIIAPAMSEGLVYLDGKIYVFNESASTKYLFGRLTTGYDLYAFNYSEFKNNK